MTWGTELLTVYLSFFTSGCDVSFGSKTFGKVAVAVVTAGKGGNIKQLDVGIETGGEKTTGKVFEEDIGQGEHLALCLNSEHFGHETGFEVDENLFLK